MTTALPQSLPPDQGLENLLGVSAAFDWIESAIAVCDRQGALRYGNAAFAKFNHAVRDSIENLHRHSSLLDCPQIAAWLRAALEGGHSTELRQTFYYAPRIQVELTLRAKPVTTPEGNIQGILLTLGEESIEFSNYHIARAQESIRTLSGRIGSLDRDKIKNDKLIRTLLTDTPFAMVLFDSGRRILQLNRAAERMFGLLSASLIGQTCERLLPCYQQCGNCPAIDQHRNIDGEEITIETSNRQSIHLLRSVTTINDDLRQPVLIEAFIDISGRKLAEKALRASEQHLRAIIEAEPECIKVVNGDGLLVEMNSTGLSMLEAGSLAEAQQQALLEYVAPKDREAFMSLHHKVMNGENGMLEFEITGLKGSKRVMETHATPMRDADGKIISLLAITRDITERKIRNTELEKYRLHLEELVKERTTRLFEAMEQSEVASRAKSYFISNLSHEFKTPMNAILGFTHILSRKISDPTQSQQLVKIELSAKQLLATLNNMLDFSRLESSELTLRYAEFGPSNLWGQISADYQQKALARELQFAVEIDPAVPETLYGDPERLQLVLANFLDNAIKFTTAGSIVLRAKCIRNGSDQVLLRFEIQDTGIGIEPGKYSAIFDSFVQGDNSSCRAFGGIGLGLSTNQKLIGLMGGEVGVESKLGEGSTFWFTAPFKKNKTYHSTPASSIASVQFPQAEVVAANASELVEEFRSLLESYDTRINARIIESNAAMQAAFGEDATHFRRLVEQYDYAAALETVRRLKQVAAPSE